MDPALQPTIRWRPRRRFELPGSGGAWVLSTALCVVLATAVAVGARQPAEATLALGGLDPVLLVEGRETQGDPLLSTVHEGLVYRFDSDRTRRAFAADPGRYAAQLGGACARMGPGVEGDPELFALHQGRIYLFGTEQCREAFGEHPERYLLPPLPPLEPSRDDLRAARELLEKAEGSLSKKPLRRLEGYRVVGVVERGGRSTGFELWLSLGGGVWRKQMVGDDLRIESWNGATGVAAGPEGEVPLRATERIALTDEALRFDALTVLGGLDLAKLTATVEEPEEPGSTRLVRLELPSGSAAVAGGQVVLEVDRHSGRVVSLRFRGRGPGGRAGWITRRFEDFRSTAGLFVPFRREDVFEGSDQPFEVTRIESIEIRALDPSLLEASVGGAR